MSVAMIFYLKGLWALDSVTPPTSLDPGTRRQRSIAYDIGPNGQLLEYMDPRKERKRKKADDEGSVDSDLGSNPKHIKQEAMDSPAEQPSAVDSSKKPANSKPKSRKKQQSEYIDPATAISNTS
jgi:hypothetical protein